MRKLSIGMRLTLWYVVIFAAAQGIFATGMWFILRHNLYEMTNTSLTGQAEDFRQFLLSQKKKNFTVAKLREEVGETYVIERSGDYLQISDSDGDWIYRSQFLQDHSLSTRAGHETYKDLQLAGKPFRFLTRSINMNGFTFTMQTGVPTDEVIHTLTIFRQGLLLLSPLALLIAACLGYGLSRRALAPVDALTRKAQTISGEDLSARLEKLNTGDELQRLSDTLNGMLARIESSFLRITQFTADASHELRTPVSLMRTEAELALRRTRPSHEYREALEHILRESERTTLLLEQLLSLARADSGRETLSFRPLNLSALAREVMAGWQSAATIRAVHLTQEIEDIDSWIRGDDSAIHRALNILLDNALKYTSQGGHVRFTLSRVEKHVVITVQDDGIGIAEDEQGKIFARFYRVDKARQRECGGAGLGLAIAQWIVRQHHGSIVVNSRLGEGSSFEVKLPIAESSKAAQMSEDSSQKTSPVVVDM